MFIFKGLCDVGASGTEVRISTYFGRKSWGWRSPRCPSNEKEFAQPCWPTHTYWIKTIQSWRDSSSFIFASFQQRDFWALLSQLSHADYRKKTQQHPRSQTVWLQLKRATRASMWSNYVKSWRNYSKLPKVGQGFIFNTPVVESKKVEQDYASNGRLLDQGFPTWSRLACLEGRIYG